MRDLDKDLKKFKERENVNLPQSLRMKIDETYEMLEEKIQVSVKGKVNNVLKISSILIVLIIGINFVSPTLAEDLPLLGTVLKVLNNKLGLEIKYTENGLAVNETYKTNNYEITIETIDYDGERLLFVYKVEDDSIKDGIYAFIFDVVGDGFVAESGSGITTGNIYNGAYYGYSSFDLNFEDGVKEREKITVKINPIALDYVCITDSGREEILDSEELKLVIKNKNSR